MKSATHEDFRAEEVQGSSDRSFGLVFTFVFLVIALLPLREGQPVRYWSLGVAGVLLLISLAIPRILAPFNRLWTLLAVVLNKVVSPIAMGLIFFLVATPTGFLMRLAGKDPLRLSWDPAATSYWIVRTPPGPPPQSMRNQF